MDSDVKQIHNKLDILLRNECIRMEYDFMTRTGLNQKQAVQKLSEKTYETWKGEKYFLGKKAIYAIIKGNHADGTIQQPVREQSTEADN